MRYLILVALLLGGTVAAETAYVTDLLRLGLHQAEDTSDRAFRTLESGQELEILSRTRNYAFVQLPDGTQGYVKAAYLVSDKPAKLIVAEAQAESARMSEEMDSLRASFAEPEAAIRTLETDIQRLQEALESANAENTVLSDENERAVRMQERYKYSLPYSWVAAAVAICLLAGFLGGLWWFEYRSRQRHGGIRIY